MLTTEPELVISLTVLTAPEPLVITSYSIFLAGSIEQDVAERWQDRVIEALKTSPVTLLNPRRKTWDSSLEQSIENDGFKEQVIWELDALDQADTVLLYFDPNTQSPVSLLELGLYASSGKLLVCCPQGFWRKGNVDIVCERFGITQFATLDALIANLPIPE